MTIPTPSAIAPLLTRRKKQELESEKAREEQLQKIESKLDEASRSKSEKVRASRASRSSKKGKGSATSSRSEAMKQHPAGKGFKKSPDTKGSPKATASEKSESQPPSTSSQEKKPFVRKPHLTQRLSSNEALQELRSSMSSPRHPNRLSKQSASSKRKQVKSTGDSTKSSSKRK